MNPLLKKLHGTGVALVTPFNKDGSIDFKSYAKLIRHVIKGKCEYIVPLGTTGESSTLSRDERKAVLSCAIEIANKKVPLVFGLGGNNTNEIIRAFDDYDFTNVDAILSVSPYYSKPTQNGIIQHYKAIANASPVPVIIYNVPSRTGSNMLADTTLTIAHDCKNVIAIKEASGNVEQGMFILKDKPKDFILISGDDSITLPLIACGASGVISVIANAYPKNFSEMVRQALNNDFAKANKLNHDLLSLIPLLFAEGNPSGIKSVLKKLLICDDFVRLPQLSVSKPLSNKIQQFVTSYK